MCVIVDEAYCEFNLLDDPDASIELLERHPNLVLLRTFSKVHGLAGLRVGFALCGSDELPRALDQVRQPFGVNALAQAAAVEALAHQDEVIERVDASGRRAPGDGGGSGARSASACADSQANFCWVHLGEQTDEQRVIEGLCERGVLVRAGAALGAERAGAARHLRAARGERAFPGGPRRGARHGARTLSALPPRRGTLACTLDRRVNVCYKPRQDHHAPDGTRISAHCGIGRLVVLLRLAI